MTAAADHSANSLLNALARESPGDWLQHLELVELPLGTVLHEPYVFRSDVYFPLSAVVSLLHVLEDGGTAEVAVIGFEGVVGVSLFMGDGISPSRAVVQCAGAALRLNAQLLKQELEHNGQVAIVLLRFMQALIAQMSQTAVCNRHHPVHQHLCRWLLLMLDRHAGDDIRMTQQLIADMLGVRRASVGAAAALLQKEGLIRYRRGGVTILDRPAMEKRVCECYAVVKSEYDRLLPALDRTAVAPGLQSMRRDLRRLRVLRQHGVLDTAPDEVFDHIARRAADLVQAPMVMISFLDEQRDWFKACIGFLATESPSETSFCNVFFSTNENTVVVENTLVDARFAQHPFVRGMPFIRFYAAVRLMKNGHTIGALCVYDVRERKFDPAQVRALESLAEETLGALKSGVQ